MKSFLEFRQKWKEDKYAKLIYTINGMLTVEEQGAGVQLLFGRRGISV